jgi:hypothetical protein
VAQVQALHPRFAMECEPAAVRELLHVERVSALTVLDGILNLGQGRELAGKVPAIRPRSCGRTTHPPAPPSHHHLGASVTSAPPEPPTAKMRVVATVGLQDQPESVRQAVGGVGRAAASAPGLHRTGTLTGRNRSQPSLSVGRSRHGTRKKQGEVGLGGDAGQSVPSKL